MEELKEDMTLDDRTTCVSNAIRKAVESTIPVAEHPKKKWISTNTLMKAQEKKTPETEERRIRSGEGKIQADLQRS